MPQNIIKERQFLGRPVPLINARTTPNNYFPVLWRQWFTHIFQNGDITSNEILKNAQEQAYAKYTCPHEAIVLTLWAATGAQATSRTQSVCPSKSISNSQIPSFFSLEIHLTILQYYDANQSFVCKAKQRKPQPSQIFCWKITGKYFKIALSQWAYSITVRKYKLKNRH